MTGTGSRGDPMPELEEWEVYRRKSFFSRIGFSEFDIELQKMLED